MDPKRIVTEMHSLEALIDYQFYDIWYLAKAMDSTPIKLDRRKNSTDPAELEKPGKNAKEHMNEGLATVGDTILKSVIADYLYSQKGIATKGKITKAKEGLEKNTTLHALAEGEKILDFAYREEHFNSDLDIPDNEKVVTAGHDPYIEAIVGAIYYDSNYEAVKEWILTWLYPRLEKYAKKPTEE